MDQILRKSQKTLAVEAKRDFWSIFWKPHAQKSREIHEERILKVEKTGYHKLQIFGATLTADHKVLAKLLAKVDRTRRSCWRRVDLQHRSCWRRLTGSAEVAAGEGLPGAPKLLAGSDEVAGED